MKPTVDLHGPPGAIVPLDATVRAQSALATVAGDPAVVRVVRSLLGPGRIPADRIVVAAVGTLAGEVRSVLNAAGLSAVFMATCEAPAGRSDCLAAGLEYLGRQSPPSSRVLVADHRCPLAGPEVTDRVLSGLDAGHSVVVPVLPMTDTVKETDGAGSVVGTIDRATLRSVQYPRGYELAALSQLLGDGDEFLAALSSLTPVLTVDGDAHGLLVDLPTDGPLLEAIIAAQQLD